MCGVTLLREMSPARKTVRFSPSTNSRERRAPRWLFLFEVTTRGSRVRLIIASYLRRGSCGCGKPAPLCPLRLRCASSGIHSFFFLPLSRRCVSFSRSQLFLLPSSGFTGANCAQSLSMIVLPWVFSPRNVTHRAVSSRVRLPRNLTRSDR